MYKNLHVNKNNSPCIFETTITRNSIFYIHAVSLYLLADYSTSSRITNTSCNTVISSTKKKKRKKRTKLLIIISVSKNYSPCRFSPKNTRATGRIISNVHAVQRKGVTTCQPCNEVNRRPTYFDGIHFEFLTLTTFSPSSARRTASTPANYLVRNSTLVHSHFANSIFLPCRPSARARAPTRENSSQRRKARRNEEVNGVTQCRRTILADKSFFESTHGRTPFPLPPP